MLENSTIIPNLIIKSLPYSFPSQSDYSTAHNYDDAIHMYILWSTAPRQAITSIKHHGTVTVAYTVLRYRASEARCYVNRKLPLGAWRQSPRLPTRLCVHVPRCTNTLPCMGPCLHWKLIAHSRGE